MSLLNDLGFATWRFVISTVDHIAMLEGNQLDTPVSLSSYSAGTLYRFPSDGYVLISASSGDVIFRLYSYSNNRYMSDDVANNAISIFVKKGMQIDIRAKTGTTDISFYPLIV